MKKFVSSYFQFQLPYNAQLLGPVSALDSHKPVDCLMFLYTCKVKHETYISHLFLFF